MTFLNTQHIRFLSSRQIQKHLLRSFLRRNFDLNSFERFALLSQKMVSTSSPKNLKKKLKKDLFKFSEDSFFEFKVNTKTFS